jgi:hypothetical protein
MAAQHRYRTGNQWGMTVAELRATGRGTFHHRTLTDLVSRRHGEWR